MTSKSEAGAGIAFFAFLALLIAVPYVWTNAIQERYTSVILIPLGIGMYLILTADKTWLEEWNDKEKEKAG